MFIYSIIDFEITISKLLISIETDKQFSDIINNLKQLK